MSGSEAFNSTREEDAFLRTNALNIGVPKATDPTRSKEGYDLSLIRTRFGVDEYVAKKALDRQRRLGGNIESAVSEEEDN